jgi:phosphoglycolate phosphatase-like HAD superfamily hydrolase
MFKNIIFDWSGVIRDADDFHLWVINRMFARFGVPEITIKELRESWEHPLMNFYNKYIPSLSLEEQCKLYKEITVMPQAPKSTYYSGMPDLILKLKKEARFLAVISGDFETTIFSEIKEYGLNGVFDEIFFGRIDKDECLQEIIAKNNLNLGETVFVGDTDLEIALGKSVGVKTVGVTWGLSDEKKLRSFGPDYLVHNVVELENILK